MKQLIKKVATRVIHPFATRLGYSKQRNFTVNSKNDLLHTFYDILQNINFKPNHIVDIGANHGTWTREALVFFPDAHFSLLEPQHWLKKSMEDLLEKYPKVKFHAVGAGKEPGSFKFTIVDRDDSCSFRYTEEQAKEMGFEQVELPIVTLNDFIKEQNLPAPDLIKIDAEGLDLEVLAGASDFFGKTEVFMVEAGIVNKDIDNSFLAVTKFMDENGYRLFDITDLNRAFQKALWLVEVVFVKKDGFIDKQRFC